MILHICCNLAGSTVFPQMFEALAGEELEQVVFVPEKRKRDMGKNLPEGVETHYVRTVRKLDTVFFSRKAKRSVPAIERSVEMSRVSKIHAHTLFTDGSIAYALSKKHGIPYVVTLRYSDIEAIWKYMPHLHGLAREILKNAAKVVFLSPAAKEKVLKKWLSKADRAVVEPKTAVIPNGIKAEWLDGEARSALSEPMRVGFAGKMDKRKRPLDALAAVHKASENGMPCVLRAVGEGKLMNDLVAGLHEGDQYLGAPKGMEAMKRFYAGIDVLLVPSSAETFGMVYLEAMSQGVPVLYTKGQGFDGQFYDGEVGYAITAQDIDGQAAALEKVIKDYPARSARCIKRAKDYAWPVIAEKWTALYSAVQG